MPLESVEIEELTTIKGIYFPKGEHFRQIIVTGPPGSGKTTLVSKLGGWPEEGYIDLAMDNWWRSPVLTFRPREVHFGFPFIGHRQSLTVFEREWLETLAPVNLAKIRTPPEKRWFFNIDWRNRYTFDFQLLPPEQIYALRRKRTRAGSHPVDMDLTMEQVEHQVAIYETLALHFHRCGMNIIIRTTFDGVPRRIVDSKGC